MTGKGRSTLSAYLNMSPRVGIDPTWSFLRNVDVSKPLSHVEKLIGSLVQLVKRFQQNDWKREVSGWAFGTVSSFKHMSLLLVGGGPLLAVGGIVGLGLVVVPN